MRGGGHMEWALKGVLFWVLTGLILLYLPLWALAERLHEKRRRRAGGKRLNEALSLPDVMGEESLPGPNDEVVILPEHSPSIHSIEIFDPEHPAVQVVTRSEAESAGFTMCVRCWDGVEPEEPKSLEDLGKYDEQEEDHDG